MNDEGKRLPADRGPMEAGAKADRGRASEAEVVDALRRGDEEAFSRLVDQNNAALRRIARLYVSSSAVVDDVLQETWLAVVQGVWAFEGRASLRTWITRILINRAKTRALREERTVPFETLTANPSGEKTPSRAVNEGSDRDRRRPRARQGDLEAAGQRPFALRDPGPSPEDRLLTQEARVQIRAAIEALPETQRLVITMKDVEGRSSEEVCNVLGLNETNQRVILHRARAKVRTMLATFLEED